MLQFFDFANNDGQATLSVAGTVVDNVDELVDVLSAKGFTFTHIDSDSVYAEISGNYETVVKAMQDLKAMGFTWKEQPLDADTDEAS